VTVDTSSQIFGDSYGHGMGFQTCEESPVPNDSLQLFITGDDGKWRWSNNTVVTRCFSELFLSDISSRVVPNQSGGFVVGLEPCYSAGVYYFTPSSNFIRPSDDSDLCLATFKNPNIRWGYVMAATE
jgi:hypothetical protein